MAKWFKIDLDYGTITEILWDLSSAQEKIVSELIVWVDVQCCDVWIGLQSVNWTMDEMPGQHW